MKKTALLLTLLVAAAHAHDHIEVGADPRSGSRLGLEGPDYQLAVYVPRGEAFSGYIPQFPGGYHAVELTFTTEVNVLASADGAEPRIEIVSVAGPAGASLSFWEVGATSPTWSIQSGWTGNTLSFPVVYLGETHAHGRCFTMDKPGTYTVMLRAVDVAGRYSSSASKTITFNAQQPPQLSIAMQGGNARLSFTSRSGLVYDLQVCTNLPSGLWTNVDPYTWLDGTGSALQMTNPVAGRPQAFYRLVEYY